MYHTHEFLLPVEKKEYRIGEVLLKQNVEPEEEGEPEALDESEHESLSSQEVREIQAQEYNCMKKSLHDKRGSPTEKRPMQQQKTSPIHESIEPSYHAIIDHLKKIRAWEVAQADIIREACKKLGKYKLEELVAAIDNLPTQKKIDKLEEKNSFLLGKANKLKAELDDQKKQNQEAIDRLNSALLFN